MPSRRVVVVTGSTAGIGRALAAALLDRGASVVINGRSEERVRAVGGELANTHGPDRVAACPGDIGLAGTAEKIWSAGVEKWGAIDIWINNAGLVTAQLPFVEQRMSEIDCVVRTNVFGTMTGARVALERMPKQQRPGAIYNMEGLGSDGTRWLGMATYGATKRAIRYFTRSLIDETRGSGVIVGTLSPGIIATDGLLDAYRGGSAENWKRARRVLNLFGDRMETVIPWLADRVLANTTHGATIAWMTPAKALLRFIDPRARRRSDIFPAELHEP